MSKICKNCGNEVRDDEIVCGRCGASVPTPPAAAASMPLKIAVLVAGILLIVATIVPFASVKMFGTPILSMSLLYVNGELVKDGILFIALAVLCIVFAFVNKRVPQLIFSIIACLEAFYEVYDWQKTFAGTEYESAVSKEIGFYLMIIAAVVLLILCIVHFIQDKRAA